MKKLLSLLTVLLIISSCTLDMEDYSLPEEQRGIDEPYTEQNEFGSVTYQFRDSVLFVTEKIQEQYLIRVEHDSILYINGNIPEEWRPYVGQKMAATISHTLPWGLNHKVIDVQDVGGIYRVTTTRVSSDDIYKQLKFCLDGNIAMPDFEGMTEEELKDYGYEVLVDPVTGDTVLMDWNDYDVAKGLRPAAARRSSLTRCLERMSRGDEDNVEEGELDDSGVAGSVFCDQFWDTRDLKGLKTGGSALKGAWRIMFSEIQAAVDKAKKSDGKWYKWNPYAGVGLKVVNYQKIHVEEDKARKYEYKYTDTWSDLTLKVEAGFSLRPEYSNFSTKDYNAQSYGDPKEMFQRMVELRNDVDGVTWQKNKIKTKTSKSWDHAKVRFPLGFIAGVPIAAVVGAKITPEIEFDGSLSVSGTYRTEKVRAYHKVENGEIKDWNDTIENGILKSFSVSGNASLKIGAKIRGYVGIEVAASVGVTFGGNLEAFAEGEVGIDFVEVERSRVESNEDETESNFQFCKFKADARFVARFFWDVQLFVAPLGIDVWEKSLYTFDYIDFINVSVSAGPKIKWNVNSTTMFGYLAGNNVPDDYGLIRARYTTGDINTGDFLMKAFDYYPGLKIYFGPISDNHWEYMIPAANNDVGYKLDDMGDLPLVSGGTTYEFIWIGDLKAKAKELGVERIDEVHFIPVMYHYYIGYDPKGKDPETALKNASPSSEFVFEDKAGWQDVAEPYIYVTNSGQLTPQDMGMCNQGSFLGVGDMSFLDRHIWRYRFYVTVDVMGGSRMKGWGLDVKIYNPLKKRIANSHRQIDCDELRSGTYTYIISFDSDWGEADQDKQYVDPKTGKELPVQLYYSVRPYWSNPRASNDIIMAPDDDSAIMKPIKFDYYSGNLEQDIMTDKDGKYGEWDVKILSKSWKQGQE